MGPWARRRGGTLARRPPPTEFLAGPDSGRERLQNAQRAWPKPGSRAQETGGVLLSQAESSQVPSALAGLTSVFGMGTGISPPLWPPRSSCSAGKPRSGPFKNSIANTSEIASKDPSPRPISTGQLNTLLCLHFRPINVVVFHGPYLVNPVARFISRRVSRLDAFSGYLFRRFANQPCSWRNNWHTRAASVPVLSY